MATMIVKGHLQLTFLPLRGFGRKNCYVPFWGKIWLMGVLTRKCSLGWFHIVWVTVRKI